MIDRSQAPHIQSIDRANLPHPALHHLDNGIPLYEIKLGTQNVLKLELVFKAGRWHEEHKLTAKATSQLLKAGTTTHSAEEIANLFEYYGATLKIYDGFNRVHIEFYCLTKHLPKLLPVLQEIVLYPAFEEAELKKFIKRNRQNLKVQLRKNDIVAYRVFTEELFGKEHPYGYNSTEAYYDQVTIDQIKDYFRRQYTAQNCMVFVAGKTSPEIIDLIHTHLKVIPKGIENSYPTFEVDSPVSFSPIHQTVSEESLQASIRIGRRTFDRKHPDWNHFYMMNMVLGGYFGARLMQNLREQNGYTYGVYSSMETLLHDGYWYIHTDVGKDVKDLAVAEIYKEIERLKVELLTNEELEMVKNYTLGMLLTSIDGVFNVASVVKSLLSSNTDLSYFLDFTESIHNIQPIDIQRMAQKYLNKETLLEVIVE
jgi:predicted Zn-dependent peptidase